jgi:hypothetical protein
MIYIDQTINNIKEAEREVKNGPIDASLNRRFLSYAQRIYSIVKNYETVYSFFKNNNQEFATDIKNNLLSEDKEYFASIVGLNHPSLKAFDIDVLHKDCKALEKIEEELLTENESIKNIIKETISVFQAKICILIELKKGCRKKAFEFAKEAYGDIDEALHEEALEYYNDRIAFLKTRDKAKAGKNKHFSNEELNADGIKYYFA